METEMMTYADFCEEHGITMHATFTGLDFEQEHKPRFTGKYKDIERPARWDVRLNVGGRSMHVTYTLGCAHRLDAKGKRIIKTLPHSPFHTLTRMDVENYAKLRHAPPLLEDVLDSLRSDASADDYASYEEWASDFGYDEDSRTGERVYHACRDNARKLRHLLGGPAMTELLETVEPQ